MKQDIIINKKFTARILKQFKKIKRIVKQSKAKKLNELFNEMKAREFCVYFLLDDDRFYFEYKNITADIYLNESGEKLVDNDIQVFDDEGERIEWHYYIR